MFRGALAAYARGLEGRDVDFPKSLRFYRLLLRLYPEELREAYGPEMERVFLASVDVQRRRWGRAGVAWAWVRVAWDTAVLVATLRMRSDGDALASLAQDVRIAARSLRRNPSFVMSVVTTLALGIGLNAAVFGAIHSLLIRPLPQVEDPGSLAQVYRTRGGMGFLDNSIPHFLDLRAQEDVFAGVAAWSFAPVNLSMDGRSERVTAQVVSADFFDVLGVPPRLGAGFTGRDALGGAGRAVVVLSHEAWLSWFGGRSDVLGRSLTINGSTWSVVGVAPRGFRGPLPLVAPALWAPLAMHPELTAGTDQSEVRSNNFLNVIARVRPGRTFTDVQKRLDLLAARLRAEHPREYEGVGIRVVPQTEAGIHPSFRTAQLGLSAVTMGVVGLLLLIACVNVANLFLARAQARRLEMSVRRSLGAGRLRILRQLLIENLLIAALAGGGGLLLAAAAAQVANRTRVSAGLPIDWNITLGWPALVFTLGVTALSSLLFGLIPALRSSRCHAAAALRAPRSVGRAEARAGRVLVGGQVAVSAVLLVCAGLFLQNLRGAVTLEKGFDAEDLLLATLDPGLQGYPRAEAEELLRTLRERIAGIPGVQAVGLARFVPLGMEMSQRSFGVPGYRPSPGETMSAYSNIVDAGYFSSMGIPILEGRGFGDAAEDAAGATVIVNRRFADRFWPGRSPVGERITVGATDLQVVGVVPTGKYLSLGEEPRAFFYLPWPGLSSRQMTLHVRADDPARVLPLVRTELASLDPDLPLFNATTMDEHLGLSLLPARLAGVVLGAFAGLCLLLLSVGIYGVVAHSVSQRTQEVGVRVALGADPRGATREVLGSELRVVFVGLVLGLAGALATTRLVERLLFAADGYHLLALLAASLFLVVVAAVASYLPARRASRIDPAAVLKAE